MSSQMVLTPDLARAARALTQVSAKYIAGRAELTRSQVQGFERYTVALTDAEQLRLRNSLEEFGAVFIAEDDEGGYGVRQKFNNKRIKAIETWEGEGGPPAEDDV
jgi:hypothetical protein